MIQRIRFRSLHRQWRVGIALVAGVLLVLGLAATTELFEPAERDGEAYGAGFDAGWAAASEPDADVLAARTEAAFTRGLLTPRSDPAARLAAAMLEMHITHTAVAVGGPFDQGFAAGLADALAGRPSVEEDG